MFEKPKPDRTEYTPAEFAEIGEHIQEMLEPLVVSLRDQGKDVVLVPHGTDKYGRTLAEVYVGGRRIEQADIGPRAGRGSGVRSHSRKSN